MARFVVVCAGVVAALSVVLAVVTYRPVPEADLGEFGFATAWVRGEVASVTAAECIGGGSCVDVVFEVTEGPDEGTFLAQSFPVGTADLEVGVAVYLSFTEGADPAFAYAYADVARGWTLLLWGALFAAAVVALGRWKGIAALVGVGVSLGVIIGYVLPTLLGGGPPVLVAVTAATLIAAVTFALTHGPTPFSAVAYLGTVGALVLTALLSDLAFSMARITGLATEEATFLTLLPGVQVSGLVLAGAVLGALGALDDVTITQTSAVWEVRAANPDLGPSDLAGSGMRVGRDHIASTVNTLVLAYAGASMPLLVLFLLSGLGPVEVLSSEAVAVEVMRTIVGSLGLVAAVPLTTWLAARVAVVLPPGDAPGHRH